MSWTRPLKQGCIAWTLLAGCVSLPPSGAAGNKDDSDEARSIVADAFSSDSDVDTLTVAEAGGALDGAGDVLVDGDVADTTASDGNSIDVADANPCAGKLGPCNCDPGMNEWCPCNPDVDTKCCQADHPTATFVCTSYGKNGYYWGEVSEDCACFYPHLPDECKIYNIQEHPGYCGLPPNP